jgi:hypothetical protein
METFNPVQDVQPGLPTGVSQRTWQIRSTFNALKKLFIGASSQALSGASLLVSRRKNTSHQQCG